MTKKMSKFTDIGQFRSVIKNIINQARYEGLDADGEPIFNHAVDAPVVSFRGTCKAHGTNLGVVFNSNDGIWVQSRSNVITPEKDNAGSAFDVMSKKDHWMKLIEKVIEREAVDPSKNDICIFAEYCGGNIQKGVAISGLPKMSIIFDVKIHPHDEEREAYYTDSSGLSDNDVLIYNVEQFGTYEMEIDFERPDKAQNEMVKLVENVEKECPVGKFFGQSGVGEGIVWKAIYKGRRYIFKTKGEKHSSSKVKKVAEVDTAKLDSILEFVDYAVTDNRLNQAIEQVFTANSLEVDVKHTGDFIRWIIADILKEELDVMADNGLSPKELNKHISGKARKWFMNYINTGLGL